MFSHKASVEEREGEGNNAGRGWGWGERFDSHRPSSKVVKLASFVAA